MEPILFELEIVTPSSSEKVKIYWVEVEGPTGSFLVGYDHCPLISLIKKKSKLAYKNNEGKEVSLDVFGGIFKVAHNQAMALLTQ